MHRNIVRSLIAFCVLVLPLYKTTAEELYPADRFFEYGIRANAGVFNNSVVLFDFLNNLSSFDLNDVLNNIPGNSFTFGGDADAKFFIGFALPNKWRFKVNVGAEANGILSLDKDLFKIQSLKAQNIVNLDTGKTDAYVDVFFYNDYTLSFPIKQTMRLSITPSLFIPLFHVSVRDLYGNFSNNNNVLHLRLRSDAEFYNSLSDVMSKNAGGNLTSIPGFDLAAAFEIETPVKELQAGAYIRIPIMPGTMTNGTTAYVDYDKTLDLNNYYASEMATLIADFTRELTQNVVSSANSIFVSRPFRTGAEISYKMFGDLLRFRGLLGLGVRYPYTKKPIVYPEYNIGVSVFGWDIVGAYLSSSYTNQVFKQEVGAFLNAKMFELHLAVSAQSSDFLKSFSGNGFGAKLFIAFGVPLYDDLF